MSHYDWEQGTIILPAAAVAQVKEKVRKAQNQLAASVYTEVKRFWVEDAKRTRSTRGYMTAYDAYIQRNQRWPRLPEEAQNIAYQVLEDLSQAPRQATWADLERCDLSRANNRDNRFLLGETTIYFAGREVSWHVSENNNACERAHQHPVAKAFFSALNQVNWTRGSGGVILGNDEYNRDAGKHYDGGGGSYTVVGFGPLGAPERTPFRMGGRSIF